MGSSVGLLERGEELLSELSWLVVEEEEKIQGIAASWGWCCRPLEGRWVGSRFGEVMSRERLTVRSQQY